MPEEWMKGSAVLGATLVLVLLERFFKTLTSAFNAMKAWYEALQAKKKAKEPTSPSQDK